MSRRTATCRGPKRASAPLSGVVNRRLGRTKFKENKTLHFISSAILQLVPRMALGLL